MARAALYVIFSLAGLGVCQAQSTNCYPRIGAYSGQYEGRCSGSEIKWMAVENSIGAYGRNCKDEAWTFMRDERMFYNHRTKENASMADCQQPTREQMANNRANNLDTEAVTRFHEGNARPAENAPARR